MYSDKNKPSTKHSSSHVKLFRFFNRDENEGPLGVDTGNIGHLGRGPLELLGLLDRRWFHQRRQRPDRLVVPLDRVVRQKERLFNS